MLRESEDGTITITLVGPFYSKKNAIRSGGAGRKGYYKTHVKLCMQSLELQARCDWGYRKPLIHPRIVVQFVTPVLAKDCDGLWTTVLDTLQKARVIIDDSINYFNGGIEFLPVITTEPHEAVVITIFPAK